MNLSLIIIGCIVTLLFSNALFSGILSTTTAETLLSPSPSAEATTLTEGLANDGNIVQPVAAQNLSTNSTTTTKLTSAIPITPNLINATVSNTTQLITVNNNTTTKIAMQIINETLSNKTASKVLSIPSQVESANNTVSERKRGVEVPSGQYDTFTLIDNDFQLGKIDLDTKIKYYVFALFDKAKLPSKYRSEHIAKDGTMVILEIEERFKKLKPETQQELAKYNITQLLGSHGDTSAPCVQLTTARDLPLAINSLHFRLHYTTSGIHAVPTTDTNVNRISDYVERVRDDFEESWRVNSDSLWESPRPDGPFGGGGSNLIDIYFYDIPSTGIAKRHSIDASTPNPNDWIGYVCFKNNLSLTSSQVGAAHEFHHLVQFAYNGGFSGDQTSWMMESSSMWFEDEVFDNNNDYATLKFAGEFLSQPDLSLTSTFGEHEYGAGIWHRFVSDQYGDPVIRNTWVYASKAPQGTGARFTDNGRAIGDVTQSGKWQEAFYAFAVNNLFTDGFDLKRDPKFRAEESSIWPRVDFNGVHPYTGTQFSVSDNDDTIEGGGTDYVIAANTRPYISLAFIGAHINNDWMVSLALANPADPGDPQTDVLIVDYKLVHFFDPSIYPYPLQVGYMSVPNPYTIPDPYTFIGIIIRNQGNPVAAQNGNWLVFFYGTPP